jgi:hypothetical protein
MAAGDSDGTCEDDGDPVGAVTSCSVGVVTTSTFGGFGGFGEFDGVGPTIAANAPRPPQQNINVEAIPSPTTDTICCGFDIRAQTCANPTVRPPTRSRSPSWHWHSEPNIRRMAYPEWATTGDY